VAFVREHQARLARACDDIVGNADVAEALRTELLVDTAARWSWRRAAWRERRALARLEKLLHRLSRSEGTAAPESALDLTSSLGMRLKTDAAEGDDGNAMLAAAAWRRSRRLRHRRWVGLALVAILFGLGVSAPRHASPPVPVPARVPDGVTVLPPLAELTGAPPGALPRRLDLSPSTVDRMTSLRDSPLTAAVMVARAGTNLVLVGADGALRRVDEPGLLGAGLEPTSLSAAGTWVALRLGATVVLLDVSTGLTREVRVEGGRIPGGPRGPGDADYLDFGLRWLDEDTLLAPGPSGSLLVDAVTAVATATNVVSTNLMTARGRRSPTLTELVTAGPDNEPAETDENVRSVILTSPNPGLPAAVQTTATARRPVTGPPWLDAWNGPGWASSRFYVRSCDLSRLELPREFGVPTSAVAAVRVTGHHAATLVSVDGVRLEPLGFDVSEPGVALVSAQTTEDTVQVLAWRPDEGRLFVVMTINADTDVSVADLLRPEWLSTVEAADQAG